MKKKFNPSAALGYKRIKPLFDKAVSDLVIETSRADANYTALCDVTVERDALSGIVERQKAKLKAAGHMVGHLIREREAAIAEKSCIVEQLIKDQEYLVYARRELHDCRHSYLQRAHMLKCEADGLRSNVGVQMAGRQKAEREKMAALADVQKLKSKVRNWAIIAGAGVGFAVAACAKVLMMGVV